VPHREHLRRCPHIRDASEVQRSPFQQWAFRTMIFYFSPCFQTGLHPALCIEHRNKDLIVLPKRSPLRYFRRILQDIRLCFISTLPVFCSVPWGACCSHGQRTRSVDYAMLRYPHSALGSARALAGCRQRLVKRVA